MHVVIVGCGRTGAQLANRLCSDGDEVWPIDGQAAVATTLPHQLRGRFIEGSGMSRAILERAGIGRADALVTLTADDCVNAVVARVAREAYRVPHVIARHFDPARAVLYHELGITAVSSVQATVNRVAQLLHHKPLEPRLSFGNGETVIVRSSVPGYLAGRAVSEMNVPGEIQVVELTRAGHSTIPEPSSVLAEHDVASFVVASQSLGRLRSFLGGKWS